MATPVSSQLLGDEDKDRILKSLPMLHKCVDLGGLMKAHLRKSMIIDLKDEQQIECQPTNNDKVNYLITEVICRGPRWKYDRLEETFYHLKMPYVVDILQGEYNDDRTCRERECSADEIRPLTDEEKQRITGNMAALTRCIIPGCVFISRLIQAGVIDDRQRQVYTCSKTARADIVRGMLTDVILKGPKWKYDAFMQALRSCSMDFIVDSIINGSQDQEQACSGASGGPPMSQLTPEEKERQLDILPKLVKTICPDCKFWACILQRRVITSDQQEVLRKKVKSGQILSLMLILLRSPSQKLEAFYEVLTKCDMNHIERFRRENRRSYVGQPWDWTAPENQVPLSQQTKVRLQGQMTLFTGTLTLGDMMWTYLLNHRVVNETMKEEIEGGANKPEWLQVTDLVCLILRSPVWTYHGFLRTLVNTDQTHLVRELDEDPSCYR